MKQRTFWIRLLSVILITAALGALLSGCGGPKRQTQEVQKTVMGIDVARFQGIVDWKEAAKSNVNFAYIRVGYRTSADGVITEDSTARYNMQEAAAAGIPIGVYFFSTAVSKEEAQEEARWVAEMVAKYPITYPVVYDCEGYLERDSRQYGLSKSKRTDNALAFLKTIEKLGYEGMFYASKNEMQGNNHWEVSRIQKRYKIWVAQYPEVPYPQTPQSSYLGDHQMWQFSTQGQIPGISQNVDMNLAYFGYDGIEPPKDPEPPEHVAPDVEALMTFEPVCDRVTAKDETNLRSIPSQGDESEILFTIQRGEYAERIAVSNSGWSKLLYQGATCYAVSSYLVTEQEEKTPPVIHDPDGDGIQTVFTPIETKVTAKDVVNLRSIPSVTSEDSQVVGQLKKGEFVTCVGVSDNGWSKLEVDGKICYAVSQYLTTSQEGETQPDEEGIQTEFRDVEDRVTAKDVVNLRNIPSVTSKDSKVVAQLKKGEVVTRTGINEDLGWSRVEYNGQTLYCVTQYLKEAE